MISNKSLQIIKDLLYVVLKKNNNLETSENRGKERVRRMTWTAVSALLAQVLQMAIPLITVRITLQYMGTEIYALWMTVNSLFALMMYADLGLGNGLQTELSQETGKKENFKGKIIVSNAYFILSIIALLFCAVFFWAFPLLDWTEIIGVKNTKIGELTSQIVMIIVIPRILSIPLSLICRCQNAMQDGYIACNWQCISSLLSLISIYLTIYFDLGIFVVILVSSSISVVIYIINTIIYFSKNKKICPDMRSIKVDGNMSRLLKIGLGFFFLSLLNAVSLNLDNYIVARADSLNTVTPFSIALRVTQLLNVACTVLSAPLWSANGEALIRGDFAWVKRMTKKMSCVSVGVVAFLAILLLLLGPELFKIWLGYDVGINRELILGLVLVQIAYAFVSPYFMFLNASGLVKVQIVLFSIFAPISIAVKFYFCQQYGAVTLPYINFILYSFLIVLPVYIFTNKQLSSYKNF